MIKQILKNNYSYEIISKIADLEKEIFNSSFYSYETLIDMIEKNDNYKIFYYEEKEILAYLILMDSIDCFEILKIAVCPIARRKGLASKLISNCVEEKEIFLEVRKSNEKAIKFYIKNGFKEIGIRKKYYPDNNEDAIIMKLEVN